MENEAADSSKSTVGAVYDRAEKKGRTPEKKGRTPEF